MRRIRWGRATAEEVRAFVAAARAFAARHPHGSVRAFVFQLAKGLEHFALSEAVERAERLKPEVTKCSSTNL